MFEHKTTVKYFLHYIIPVNSLDQSLSLVAWVHGSPAELVISHLTFHEAPHRATHHRHWFLARQDQDLTHCIYLNSLPEELAYVELKSNEKNPVSARKTCTCRKQM